MGKLLFLLAFLFSCSISTHAQARPPLFAKVVEVKSQFKGTRYVTFIRRIDLSKYVEWDLSQELPLTLNKYRQIADNELKKIPKFHAYYEFQAIEFCRIILYDKWHIRLSYRLKEQFISPGRPTGTDIIFYSLLTIDGKPIKPYIEK